MHDDDPRRGHKRTAGRAGLLAAALACGALLLALAACGGGSTDPQVAGSGSSSTTASSSSKNAHRDPLKYAACMRSHGVADFPDPNSSGGYSIPSDIDLNSPQFRAADNACKGYVSGLGVKNVSPAHEAQIEATALKFAQCMRSHGVPNYPDPGPVGKGGNPNQPPWNSIDTNSPTFLAAAKVCSHSG